MSALTNNTVATTYQSLLKTTDSSAINSTLKNISDGLGNATALNLSTTDVSVSGSLILNGNLILNTNQTINTTASYAVTASYVVGASPVIGVSGSTIYSMQPDTFNFSTTNGVFLGDNAGADALAADNSVFIGTAAGQDAIDSTVAVFIGAAAGQGASNADNSVFIGSSAGTEALTAQQSIFIGNTTGQGAINATYSTLLGYQVGANYGVTGIGSNNVIIGTNITLPDDTANTVNIGGVLFVSGAYSNISTEPLSGSVQGARAGIGTLTPTATLDVSGSLNVTSGSITLPGLLLLDFADDAAAQAGGVQVGGLYRNGNVISIRII